MTRTSVFALAALTLLAALAGCSQRAAEVKTAETVDTTKGEIVIDTVLAARLQLANLRILSGPELDAATGRYSLTASAQKTQEVDAPIVYSLLPKGESEPAAVSTTGEFAGVDGLEGDGVYVLRASIEGMPQVEPLEKEIAGMRRVVRVEPYTAAELQQQVSALASGSSDSPLLATNERISPELTLTFSNIEEGETRPTSFAAVMEKLFNEDWSALTVTGVTHDTFGRLATATFTITYP